MVIKTIGREPGELKTGIGGTFENGLGGFAFEQALASKGATWIKR
ncbi:hypothetical protein [Anaerobacillus alkaliphilus]